MRGLRDLCCEPFGHVLYLPRGWKFWAVPWECACQKIMLGSWGGSPWHAFRCMWSEMRTR